MDPDKSDSQECKEYAKWGDDILVSLLLLYKLPPVMTGAVLNWLRSFAHVQRSA